MLTILTEKGQEILVDEEDWHLVAEHTWCLRNGYAATTIDGRGLYMHRMILGLDGSRPIVDHKNRNRLDNQKQNLRICTFSQNSANRIADSDSKTGMKGVCPDRGRFRAYIMVNGKSRHLGCFETPELAKEFRDLAADILLGDFARA